MQSDRSKIYLFLHKSTFISFLILEEMQKIQTENLSHRIFYVTVIYRPMTTKNINSKCKFFSYTSSIHVIKTSVFEARNECSLSVKPVLIRIIEQKAVMIKIFPVNNISKKQLKRN